VTVQAELNIGISISSLLRPGNPGAIEHLRSITNPLCSKTRTSMMDLS
jgi:hypothetical protein